MKFLRVRFVTLLQFVAGVAMSTSMALPVTAEAASNKVDKPGRKPGRKPGKAAAKGGSRDAKYRDGDKVWGGRGRRPKWLREAIAAGKSMKDFAV